jgi:hypothetical protein
MRRLALLLALLPALAAPLRAGDSEDRASALVRDNSQSLVFVEDESGAGSGFVATLGGKPFVFTNQHVVAGHPGVRFTLLDRSPIKVAGASAAVAHDVMIFAADAGAKALEVMTEVERNAAIGDEVAVLGNPEGARVIKPLVGKLVGIGPNLVEVTAEFVPGNSGSPIIHLKSGKVIGIATYAVIRELDALSGRRQPQIRRFGFRLDSVKQWQPVAWPAYNEEFVQMEKIQSRTQDLAALLRDMSRNGTISAERHQNPALKAPIERFVQTTSRNGISVPDRARAVQDLLASLRSACQSDVEQARPRIRYDFFQSSLRQEQEVRTQFHKVFDEILKAQRK